MALVIKYGSTFILIGGLALAVALLLISFMDYGGKGVAINYCIGTGSYEERVYNNALRGYCVFNSSKCGVSECPLMEYFNGECTQCNFSIKSCTNYTNVRICEQDYTPICAKIRSGITAPFVINEKSFGNACTACINAKENEVIISYVNRSCEY